MFSDPKFKKKVRGILKGIKESLYDLHDIATRDEKTGLYNYRFFKAVFEMELEKAKRGKQKLSFAVIDIDFFKKVNDTHGHLVGDEILVELGRVLTDELRKYDVLARFGGEEFFVFFPGTSVVRAKQIAERLRKSVVKGRKMKRYGVTISLGVTEYKNRDTAQRMIARADKALFVSKKKGRNQVNVL